MKKQGLFVIYMAVFLLLNPGFSIAAISQQSFPSPLQCSASSLSFNLDGKSGYFDGMSQSGVLLVLHNIGSQDCSVPARPILSFEDAEHHPLPISLQIPMGMHPGPVILPIVIPVDAWVTSQMRWISSDVYGGNNCVSPAFVTLSVEKDTLRHKFTGYLCGPAGKNPTYTVTLFKHDSTYRPSFSRKWVKKISS